VVGPDVTETNPWVVGVVVDASDRVVLPGPGGPRPDGADFCGPASWT
jgi:hypothetical protein